MPGNRGRGAAISPLTIALGIVALALVVLAIYWLSAGHGRRGIATLVVALLVAGGAGFTAYVARK